MADDRALRELAAEWTADADSMPFSSDLRRCASDLTSVLDSTAPASDGGECPHIVTSDEAAKGLRLLDAYLAALADWPAGENGTLFDFLGWSRTSLRPILAAAADPEATE